MATTSMAGLNKAQLEAVTTRPNSILQILAGPGSGKTNALTRRVCFLLEQGLKPENIILTTFTNKAAREMKERIRKLGGDGVESRLITGTFHSICRRFLVKYGTLISLPKGFGIADTDDSKSILKALMKEMRSSIEPEKARSVISAQKSRAITAGQYHAEQLRNHRRLDPRTQATQLSIEMAEIYLQYENKLKSMSLLDFDDILLRTCSLLRAHPHCISNIQHVLIDEFQDTNIIQYELMCLFAQRCNSISIVGDPDQGIYGWRSANLGNLKQMQIDYDDVIVVNLEENYRSSTWILKASLAIIEQDSSRFAKTLLGTKCWGSPPVLRTLANAFVEARWISREIKRVTALTGGMIKEKDIAVLVRMTSLTRPIESAFTGAGLRYRMVGSHKFFDREEIKDVLAYLRVIHSLQDTAALMRIINVPNRRVGKERIAMLIRDTETKNRSLWESIQALIRGEVRFSSTDKSAEASLISFTRNIKRTRERLALNKINSIWDLIDDVRTIFGYDDHLRKKFGAEADERIGNLEELKIFATEVDRMATENNLPDLGIAGSSEEETALSRFLGNITLMTDVRDGDEQDDCITISTIHAAKGLEWPVVFIPGVYQGSIPHLRAEDIDEERRLLYVAMTRAQALLYLSFPAKNSNGDDYKLSMFVEHPTVLKLLVTKAGGINVNAIATILERPVPTEGEISTASANLLSIYDDEWIECNPESRAISSDIPNHNGKPTTNQQNGTSHQKIREWRPQTTVTPEIGSQTAPFWRSVNTVGHETTNRDNIPQGITMGFVSSRKVLSVRSNKQPSTQSLTQKRKADDDPPCVTSKRKPSESRLAAFVNNPYPVFPDSGHAVQRIKVSSSGIVRDRRKPIKGGSTLPLQAQSSSPARGYDLDALPSVSFSSPKEAEGGGSNVIELKSTGIEEPPTSPLRPLCNYTKEPIKVLSHKYDMHASHVPVLSTERRSLGIRRGMKPWPSKKSS